MQLSERCERKSFEKMGGRLHNANMCLTLFVRGPQWWPRSRPPWGPRPRLKNADVRWNDPQMSFSVIGRGSNRKLVYELLLVVFWLRYWVKPALVHIASDEASNCYETLFSNLWILRMRWYFFSQGVLTELWTLEVTKVYTGDDPTKRTISF